MPKRNAIDEESKLIEALVLYAKGGQWEEVWKIIGTPEMPKKTYLLNVIPETRRWGVLHQAVYWNNPDIIKQLLRFPGCDSDCRAKACTSECGFTGKMNALEIARAYKYDQMASILEGHVCTWEAMDTFQPWKENVESTGLGLIHITLSAYKTAFHPAPIDPSKGITEILRDIYNNMLKSETRWKAVRDKVADSVYTISEEDQKKFRECKSRDDFFQAIINTYSTESNYLYTYLSTALRRQRDSNYQPTAHDLAVGPYVTVYQMLLLFYEFLPKDSEVTYRKMKVSDVDMAKYTIGTKFTWLSIVSSAKNKATATIFPTCGPPTGDKYIVFTIDNTAECMWQPRNIEDFAAFDEEERTYPAGASFKIVGRQQVGTETHVRLELLKTSGNALGL